jgi:hypothetical protein
MHMCARQVRNSRCAFLASLCSLAGDSDHPGRGQCDHQEAHAGPSNARDRAARGTGGGASAPPRVLGALLVLAVNVPIPRGSSLYSFTTLEIY